MSFLSDKGNSDESSCDLSDDLSTETMGNFTNTKHHIYFNDGKSKDDKWDNKHVKLPCSNANSDNYKRWILIEKSLRTLKEVIKTDQDSLHIEHSIKKYNQKLKDLWDFKALHYLINKSYDDSERESLFSKTIPDMIDLTLKLPDLITKPIPMLAQKMNFSLTFTQEQLASLLANAFFCTFPSRNIYEDNSHGYDKLPTINFDSLMCTYKQGGLKIKIEKLKCILNYFNRITQSMPSGLVTFTRRCINEFPIFEKSNSKIFDCEIRSDGTIEDCEDALQMDFANKYIGGGVLSRGCVQEEIRFVLCPELMISCLFCHVMLNNECILVRGFERFNSYKGYANTFEWNGDFRDTTTFDSLGHRKVELLALDALHFINKRTQFDSLMISRELKKAYCGFKQDIACQNADQKIATGNWGCGAFNGDIQLKFLIQLIAAAECKRNLIYFTFGNQETCKKLEEIYKTIKEFEFTSAQILGLLKQYCQEIDKLKNKNVLKHFDLYEFFKTKYDF